MKASGIPVDEDIIIYKGKIYKGVIERDVIKLSPYKRGFLNKKDKVIKLDKMAVLGRHVYDLLVKNTKEGKVESTGMVGGSIKDKKINVDYILNFLPPQKSTHGLEGKGALVLGGGYGAEIVNEKNDRIVNKRGNIIGFYHSHPHRETLSSADLKEFKKASKFDSLKEPIKFHILCRRSGFNRWISKNVLLPFAFYKSFSGKYKQIPILLTKN